jgi:transposase
MSYKELTDLQWQVLEPLFPNPIKRGRGKPHVAWRKVLNSIFFVLETPSKWDSLPVHPEFASKSAAHRWYKAWQRDGFLDQILTKLRDFSMLAGELKFPATRVRSPKIEQEPLAMAVN